MLTGQHEISVRVSGSEPLATLAPPTRQDGAPGPSPHAQPESVRLVPAPVAGLERALAHGPGSRVEVMKRPLWAP